MSNPQRREQRAGKCKRKAVPRCVDVDLALLQVAAGCELAAGFVLWCLACMAGEGGTQGGTVRRTLLLRMTLMTRAEASAALREPLFFEDTGGARLRYASHEEVAAWLGAALGGDGGTRC